MRALSAALLALVLGALCGVRAPSTAHAEADAADAQPPAHGPAVVYARVVVERAALRTGPGATFRLVRSAEQGETFPVQERAPRGFWLRVELPDGTSAYVQGDAVYIHEVGERSRGARVLGKIFAPPPLLAAHGEISISLGALGQGGFMAVRPVWLLAPNFGFEANLAASVSSSGRLFLGGLGGVINLFPSWPVVPFAAAGGGFAYASPNADSFVLGSGSSSALYAGGGLRFGFRQRLIVRVEARGYAFFDANRLLAQQEISGGLSAFF
jgi:hypothetical protein